MAGTGKLLGWCALLSVLSACAVETALDQADDTSGAAVVDDAGDRQEAQPADERGPRDEPVPDLVTVPDVLGEREADATSALEDAGFVVRARTGIDDEADPGTVYRSDPEPGDEVDDGSRITIFVARDEPEPDPDPEPEPEPDPEPEPEPESHLAEPVVYEGSGDDVITIEKPGAGDSAVIAQVSGNSEGRHFAVVSHDDAGNRIEALVNTTDPYEGTVPIDFDMRGPTEVLEVSATGSWRIELHPLPAAREMNVRGRVEGNGDDVVIAPVDSPMRAYVRGNEAERHFAVRTWGDTSRAVVNTTERYEGTVQVPGGTLLLQVMATGPWSIELE